MSKRGETMAALAAKTINATALRRPSRARRAGLGVVLVISLMAWTTASAVTAVAADPNDGPGEPDETILNGDVGSAEAAAAPVVAVETQGVGNNYVLLDSTDPGGPAFDYTGCTNRVFDTSISQPDDDEANVAIPFIFTYYGTSYTTLRVGVNGGAILGETGNVFAGNGALEIHGAEGPQISVFWDDLEVFDNSTDDTVWYCTVGAPGNRILNVWWENIERFSADGLGVTATFGLKLFEADESIEFHYQDVEFEGAGDLGASATVGIDSGLAPADTEYLQYSLNMQTLENGSAIRFFIPQCGGAPAQAVGTRGSDTFIGGASVDNYYGHLGDDTIDGNSGDDLLCGAEGRDRIWGGRDNDMIWGGLDIDYIRGELGNDLIEGEGGSDRIWGGPGLDTLNGGSGADRIWGGPDADIINGQGGKDFIKGDAGDDDIQGNHQSDVINGGTGNDVLRGAGGKDTLFGDGGTDELFGGDNSDALDGGPGNDLLNGQKGRDTCTSGGGVDTFISC